MEKIKISDLLVRTVVLGLFVQTLVACMPSTPIASADRATNIPPVTSPVSTETLPTQTLSAERYPSGDTLLTSVGADGIPTEEFGLKIYKGVPIFLMGNRRIGYSYSQKDLEFGGENGLDFRGIVDQRVATAYVKAYT